MIWVCMPQGLRQLSGHAGLMHEYRMGGAAWGRSYTTRAPEAPFAVPWCSHNPDFLPSIPVPGTVSTVCSPFRQNYLNKGGGIYR